MPKDVILNPNQRVDIPDLEDKTSNFNKEALKQSSETVVQAKKPSVLEGFRVRISDQSTAPGEFTIFNGVALDRSGKLITNEEDYVATRTETIEVDGTYYIEIEFVEVESDVDARAFWNTSYDNGTDPSGDPKPFGREFNQTTATRLTPDWQIVTPISTTGFDVDADPDSTKVPVCVIVVSGGEITTSGEPLKTIVTEYAAIGSTELKVISSREFGQTGDIEITYAADYEESDFISFTANDVENGILTLDSPTTFDHFPGDYVILDDVTGGLWLPERPELTVDDSDTVDGRKRYFQGDEDIGYALSVYPTGDSFEAVEPTDLQIHSLQRYVDFLAGQMREMKFGKSSSEYIGASAPPMSFSELPRYFEYAGGIASGRTATVTVGDGENTWGDYNTVQMGSATAAISAAVSIVPAGGTVYIKAGTYQLDNDATAIAINKSLSIIGDVGTIIETTSANPAFNITAAGGEVVNLENLGIQVSGTASLAVSESSGADLVVLNCSIQGLGIPSGSGRVLVISSSISAAPNANGLYAVWSDDNHTNPIQFLQCSISTTLADDDARAVLFEGGVSNAVVFYNCDISAGDCDYAIEFGTVAEGVIFDSCTITTPVATTIGATFGATSKVTVVNTKCDNASGDFTDFADLINMPNGGDFGGFATTGDIWTSGEVAADVVTANDFGIVSCVDVDASGDVDVGDDLTVTGEFYHGERTLWIPINAFTVVNDTNGAPSDYRDISPSMALAGSAGDWYMQQANANDGTNTYLVAHLPLHVGDQIKAIKWWGSDNSGAAITLKLWHIPFNTGTAYGTGAIQIGATQSTSNSANYQALTISGLTHVVEADTLHFVEINHPTGNQSSWRTYGVYVTYDRVP